jgi:hypothetical protein
MDSTMRKLILLSVLLAAGCATVPAPAPAPDEAARAMPQETATAAPEPAPTAEAERPAPAPTAPDAAADVPAPAAPDISFKEFVAQNDQRLLDVYPGMSKTVVDKLMSGHTSERLVNPAKRQTLKTRDGKLYEVQFYITRTPTQGKPVTENHMTPVILRDGKVAAIGRYPLKKIRRNVDLAAATQAR